MRVLTLGTFDLFHAGHVNLLRQCRDIARSGVVTVGLNTDEFVARYKGRRPIIPYEDRQAVVASCQYVDEVVPNNQPFGSAADVIIATHPNTIVVGDDWQDRDYPAQLGVTWEWLRGYGTDVHFVPYTRGISSTDIKQRLGM